MPFLTTGKILRFWFPVILYSGIIFYASSLPDLKPPLEVPYIDKLVHLIEYALLGLLTMRAMRHTAHWPYKEMVVWVVLFSLLYGTSDEIHQYFVPGRTCSWADLVFDGLGSFLGSIIYKK